MHYSLDGATAVPAHEPGTHLDVKGMITLAAYSLDLPSYACARLRLIGPASRLAGSVDLRWGARSDGRDYAIDASAMDGADAVVFQRYFPMEGTWPLVEKALGSGRPVIYDLDDNFLAVPEGHPMAARLAPVAPYARELLSRASLVTVSTPRLGRAFSACNAQIEVLPNLIDESLWDVPSQPRPRGPVRIVHAGTPSHAADLSGVTAALARVKERFGRDVELVFMGSSPEGLDALSIPFAEDYAAYARALSALAPDIGVAPLEDTPFNRCKSAVKWLEYSAAGAAGVFSDCPAYECVRHGETGLKVRSGEWEEAVSRLVEDEALRRSLSGRARGEALGRWSLRAGVKAYLRVWRRAVHGR